MKLSGIVDEIGRGHGTNVFVHSVTSIGNLSGVNLNDDESHRALLFAGPQDVVVVPSPVDTDFLGYVDSLGLGIPVDRVVVASDGAVPAQNGSLPETLLSNPGALMKVGAMCGATEVALNPFIATDVEWRLAAALRDALGRPVRVIGAAADRVRNANMKHVIRGRAVDCGVPVTPAELVRMPRSQARYTDETSILSAAIERAMAATGRVVVKGSFGASGSSTFIVDNLDDVAACIAAVTGREDNDIYIVEPLYEIVCSPNVVMWIDPDGGEISCVSVNDQCIDRRLVFAGSTFPSVASLLPEMIDGARLLTSALRSEGFSGAAGFDFCEYDDPATGKRKYFLSELNARINGGMYATALMERLNRAQEKLAMPPISALRSASVFAAPTTFAAVKERIGEFMFDPASGAGVIPFNPGRLVAGKVALACFAGDVRDAEGLHAACRDRLS